MRRRIPYLAVIVSLFLAVSIPMAQDFKNLGADEVKKKMIDSKKKAVVVDARSEAEYRDGHIPTSINIPYERFPSIQKFLPKDKNTPVVFYCRGIG